MNYRSLQSCCYTGAQPGLPGTSPERRQVARLRHSNGEFESRVKDLSAVARDYRELAERVHGLTLTLLALDSAAERFERLHVGLRRDFSVDPAALIRHKKFLRSKFRLLAC